MRSSSYIYSVCTRFCRTAISVPSVFSVPRFWMRSPSPPFLQMLDSLFLLVPLGHVAHRNLLSEERILLTLVEAITSDCVNRRLIRRRSFRDYARRAKSAGNAGKRVPLEVSALFDAQSEFEFRQIRSHAKSSRRRSTLENDLKDRMQGLRESGTS